MFCKDILIIITSVYSILLIIIYSTAPSQPLNVTAYNVSSTSIMVTWEPPMMPNGIIRSYRVQFNRTTDGSLDNINTNNTSVVITLLKEMAVM